MYVVATAGHVDHGKSTLVRALTDMDPDRWKEEKQRGLTIDLGFVWTKLPSGADLAFVDVPGHERFLSNMLAGVGPASVVLFVVAADEGWQQQSADHRDALAAFGIEHGVVALTRCDKTTPDQQAATQTSVREELADTALFDAPIVPVSARTGEGLGELREALDRVLATAATAAETSRLRLWLDRSFTVKGAGTVVTGTLAASEVSVGERLVVSGGPDVTVRGLQSEKHQVETIRPVSRAAVNLRGIAASEVRRGDVLVRLDEWPVVEQFDARRVTGRALTEVPAELAAHIGTASLTAHVRPLDGEHARITLSRGLPLEPGDRFVLRAPGSHQVLAGVSVLDVAPPDFTRRGAARRRADELAHMPLTGDPTPLVRRDGAVKVSRLRLLGYATDSPPKGIIAFKDWWIHAPQVRAWKEALLRALEQHAAAEPLSEGLARPAARDAIGVTDDALLNLAIAAAKVESAAGVVRPPGAVVDLGGAETAVAELERRLYKTPFAAPEAGELSDLGLGTKELAAAERAGRVLRLAGGVVLLPSAPRLAAETLKALGPNFTLCEARRALGTTRRIAVPLLEYLDQTGITRRDGNVRTLT